MTELARWRCAGLALLLACGGSEAATEPAAPDRSRGAPRPRSGPPVESFEEALSLVPTLGELERERPAADFDGFVRGRRRVTLWPVGLEEEGIPRCRPLIMHFTDDALHTHIADRGELVLGAELMLGAETIASLGAVERRAIRYDGVLVRAGVGCDRETIRHLSCPDGRELRCERCEQLGTRLESQIPGVSYQRASTESEDVYEDAAQCDSCPPDELRERVDALEVFLREMTFVKRESGGPRFHRSRRACQRDR